MTSPAAAHPSPRRTGTVRLEVRSHRAIDPAAWDALAAANPWSTPFSDWAFHAAWWDGYGANATERTWVAFDGAGTLIGIVPLMARHAVEPTDAATHTALRHHDVGGLTPVRPAATVHYFGASYHADYATILAAPGDQPAIAEALAARHADSADSAWDALDLRRFRAGDPAAGHLAAAFGRREIAAGWTLNLEREDVCPVVTLPAGGTLDDYLATLDKKARHEIRRKVRRAEAAGRVELRDSEHPLDDLDAFIDLHQRRWGADGLFPSTPGGDQSRAFARSLFERFGADGPLRLAFLTIDGRRIAAGVSFERGDTVYYYNAGVDPAARDLSPGVTMIFRYAERAIAEGRHRLDFLRGDEPYKYEWGAVDEPIWRLLVRRGDG